MFFKCYITRELQKLFRKVAPTEQITFLLNEVSELRQIVRFFVAESPRWQEWMQQTRESFDSQWHLMPAGIHMISDSKFLKTMTKQVVAYTGLPEEWFHEKKILDTGCGNGRWSYALSRLGAVVTAVDQSEYGLEATSRQCTEFPLLSAVKANLLDPLPFENGTFDLVWSFGVLRHTRDTHKGFPILLP